MVNDGGGSFTIHHLPFTILLASHGKELLQQLF